ncbi:hypothetical protein Bca4012_000977 [Brassica carinata]
MISFVAFLAFIVHIFDIPNHNGEEPAPSPTGALPLLSPSAGSSPPLESLPQPLPLDSLPSPPPLDSLAPPPLILPQPALPSSTGPTASSQPDLPRRQSSNHFLNIAPPLGLTNLENHVPDPHQMDTLSWTALVYCFTAGLEFNAIFAQAGNPSNVTIRVHFLSVLLSIALHLLIAANGIFARTHPYMARVMDRAGTLIVLISSTIAAMPTVPEYVSIGCAMIMIILYAYRCFISS